jgi:hypothetical protein
MAALAKLADVKTRLGWSGTAEDALMTQLLEIASSVAAGLVGMSSLLRETGIVEFPSHPRGVYMRLTMSRWPIESVTSIKQLDAAGTDADFTAADALTEHEDYVVDAARGRVDAIVLPWLIGPRLIRVEYTAGYVDPSTVSPPATAIQPPADLQHGVIETAIRMWQQRDAAGVTNLNAGQAGDVSLADRTAHPALIAACNRIRRWM